MSITLAIVLITCGVSIWALNDYCVMEKLIFDPIAVTERKEYYRFLTSGFVHADFMHLGFNMMSFYSFGEAIEKMIFSDPAVFGDKGNFMYILLYLSAIVFSEIPSYFKNKNNENYRSLGASGGVSGIIFAFVIFYPQIKMSFFFLPGIPGYIFCVLFVALSTFLERNYPGRINHMAHIFGALFGIIFVFVFVKLLGNMDLLENFMRQIKSSNGKLLPLY